MLRLQCNELHDLEFDLKIMQDLFRTLIMKAEERDLCWDGKLTL